MFIPLELIIIGFDPPPSTEKEYISIGFYILLLFKGLPFLHSVTSPRAKGSAPCPCQTHRATAGAHFSSWDRWECAVFDAEEFQKAQ